MGKKKYDVEKVTYDRFSWEPNSNNGWHVSEFRVTAYDEEGRPCDGGYFPLLDATYNSETEAKAVSNARNRDCIEG